MANELTEQEKLKLMKEVFKDAVSYLDYFKFIEEINCWDQSPSKMYFDSIRRNRNLELQEAKSCDNILETLSIQRDNALENFESLKQKYGLDFLNEVLPKKYGSERFEQIVKEFDKFHKDLSYHISFSLLEVKTAATAVQGA